MYNSCVPPQQPPDCQLVTISGIYFAAAAARDCLSLPSPDHVRGYALAMCSAGRTTRKVSNWLQKTQVIARAKDELRSTRGKEGTLSCPTVCHL
eukprot:3674242-Amphidinium_carterae.1